MLWHDYIAVHAKDMPLSNPLECGFKYFTGFERREVLTTFVAAECQEMRVASLLESFQAPRHSKHCNFHSSDLSVTNEHRINEKPRPSEAWTGHPWLYGLSLEQQTTPKQRILKMLNPEDTRPSCAFVIKRL